MIAGTGKWIGLVRTRIIAHSSDVPLWKRSTFSTTTPVVVEPTPGSAKIIKGELRDFSTWSLFSHNFVSRGLMWTTVFEIGPVLSERASAVSRETAVM